MPSRPVTPPRTPEHLCVASSISTPAQRMHEDSNQLVEGLQLPGQPSSNKLIVIMVTQNNKLYNVMPLAAGVAPPRTAHDFILPPLLAFCDPKSNTAPQYPAFTAENCSWQAVLDLIRQPSLVWPCWGPGNLGEFPTITLLWQAWSEGKTVAGVGRTPPIRDIDQQWGGRIDLRTKKGKLPAWRPRQDPSVSALVLLLVRVAANFQL
jgi:hypothetical protein